MATVTKSIGTSSRDYSTITAWEADLDDTNIYTSGDDAVGECYNDSTFTSPVYIDGGATVGLSSVKLSVAEGERHDGTIGTGVYLNMQTLSYVIVMRSANSIVEWITVSPYGVSSYSSGSVIDFYLYSDNKTIRNSIIKGEGANYPSHSPVGIKIQGNGGYAYNNIIYNHKNSGSGSPTGRGILEGYRTYSSYNNTIYNCDFGYGATSDSSAGTVVKNNLSTGNGEDFVNDSVQTRYAYNNISSDNTINDFTGTGNVSNVTTDSQFVSTVSGSEDLHLKTGSDAIGAGADLGITPDGVQYDIDGFDRDAGERVWDIGADQATLTITKTIGTAGREYSTFTAWEADLDNSTYQAGDAAVAEAYNDSIFNYPYGSQLTVNGGTTVGLGSITLTVAESERHDGTYGTGATITGDGTSSKELIQINTNNTTVEWLSIFIEGIGNYGAGVGIQYVLNAVGGGYTSGHVCRYNVMKSDGVARAFANSVALLWLQSQGAAAYGNIIYNHKNSNFSSGSNGIYSNYGGYGVDIFNNTVHNCTQGYQTSSSTVSLKNNIATENNPAAFGFSMNAGSANSNNMSSDNTADDIGGDDTIVGVVTANQFVSIVSGSEDLHLGTSSDAIGAGIDLGTTPDGVQYDIDNELRSEPWSIGADHLAAAGGHIRRTLLGIG